MAEIILNVVRLGKVLPNGKELFKNISLGFFRGAKIGVVGPNGAGKTSLLRILAGEDEGFQGEIIRNDKIRIGYLPQEPRLDESLDVRGNVELGLKNIRDLLTRFEEVSMRFSEPMSDEEMNKTLEEQGRLQDGIDACDGWDLESRIDLAMEALRCLSRRHGCDAPVRRGEAPGRPCSNIIGKARYSLA